MCEILSLHLGVELNQMEMMKSNIMTVVESYSLAGEVLEIFTGR